MGYFDTLFGYEWELTKSPAGAHQWQPKGDGGAGTCPDAHDPVQAHAPMMTTADLALRMDPAYEKISRRFHQNPQEFADAFARAWFKLTHRDMGPRALYRGRLVPKETADLAGPVPARPSADRRGGHRGAEGQDPGLGPVGLAAGHHGLGLGLDLPRLRQARRRQRRAHPPGAAEGLGGQPARRAGQGAGRWKASRRSSTPAQQAARRCRWPI
jgi:hypothetical protein